MRVTIKPQHSDEFTLVDGTFLNSWSPGGEMFILRRDGLQGWFESAESRGEEMPGLPGTSGQFWPEEVFTNGRVLTVRGTHISQGNASTLSTARFRDSLAALVGQSLSMWVADSAGSREVSGFVSGRVNTVHRTETVTDFSLIITCPDPLKYGQPVTYQGPGLLPVENIGTGDVPLVVSTPDRVTRIYLELAGRRVEWQGDAEGLVLDLSDGVPRDSHGDEVGVLVWADLLRVPPGQHELQVESDAVVTLTVRPGWK